MHFCFVLSKFTYMEIKDLTAFEILVKGINIVMAVKLNAFVARGNSQMKEKGTLVVSMRGVSYRFWFHLEFSG